MEDLKKLIREVPDFPKPGILFYDITTLLKDPGGLRGVIDGLRSHYREAQVDVVLGVEARGFIFAPALAYALGAGFVPVRKPNKLPAECVSVTYDLEYGTDCLEMHRDAVGPGHAGADRGRPAGHRRHCRRRGAHGPRGRRHGGRDRLRGRADLPQRAPETGRQRRLFAAPVRQMKARGVRRARVRALAKINLDLRVLGKRPDGYHELRTIFQTISLADAIEIAFTPAPATDIELDDPLAIADNLVVRAARLAMDGMGVAGRVAMRLNKRIPMGAGLGGGSSDAAAVLLALPVLAGQPLSAGRPAPPRPAAGQRRAVFPAGRRRGGDRTRTRKLFPLPDAGRATACWWLPGCMFRRPKPTAF